MSIYREPARMALIQLRKAAETQEKQPKKQEQRGLLSPTKMINSSQTGKRKSEAARVLDIMTSIREAMSGEV
jgi:hypothetical protein